LLTSNIIMATKGMKCIFCRSPEVLTSKSKEHVIPESLGNKSSILLPGIVCDSCNNYLAREVEKPILDSPMFRFLRYDRSIPNKRGRIPSFKDDELPLLPDYRTMARLLGKIGLETLALRVLTVPEWNDEIVNKTELDELRSFVRYNKGKTWPFIYRTIYPVNAVFEEELTHYEIFHEFNLLYTDWHELFIVAIIFGVEFALNLGGPEIDGYIKWLEQNDYQSPLYPTYN